MESRGTLNLPAFSLIGNFVMGIKATRESGKPI